MSPPVGTGSGSSPETGRAAAAHLEVPDQHASEPLRACVAEAVENYFRHLGGHDPSGLYALVMAEVETPLLETVLAHAKGNRSRAAAMLGINRATLRKKLERCSLA